MKQPCGPCEGTGKTIYYEHEETRIDLFITEAEFHARRAYVLFSQAFSLNQQVLEALHDDSRWFSEKCPACGGTGLAQTWKVTQE